MLVTSVFPGDDDEPTKHVQHENYTAALQALVGGAIATLVNAYRLTDQPVPEALSELSRGARFDHRVVQAAHDHLAAAWRYRTGRLDPSLPFAFVENERVAGEWIDWLRSEVAKWANDDHQLVRLVAGAVSQQNTEEGYEAERALGIRLRERYPLPSGN